MMYVIITCIGYFNGVSCFGLSIFSLASQPTGLNSSNPSISADSPSPGPVSIPDVSAGEDCSSTIEKTMHHVGRIC